jgi:pyruvate dehydrogenase E1 component alpha subunit
MHTAVERARAGRGASVIEAVTYRIEAHTTSDDPRRYRDAAEVDAWRARDPIPRFRRELQARDLWDDACEAAAEATARAAVARLREKIFDAPDPEPLGIFDHVYADPTAALLEQRAMLAAEQDPRA